MVENGSRKTIQSITIQSITNFLKKSSGIRYDYRVNFLFSYFTVILFLPLDYFSKVIYNICMVIAIDGPAGAGKSTIARLLAERLHLTYINSGNIYRVLTLGCLKKGIDIENPDAVIMFAEQANITYCEREIFLDQENVNALLHSDEIDKTSPLLSAIVPIRRIVNTLIRKISKDIDVVVEGRDMTSVVFPNAEYRFYLDASVETRAKRRFEQSVSGLSLEEITAAIQKRDEIDRNKIEGSLKIVDGVIVLDTADLTIEQTYDKLLAYIRL
ncbi:MAG: (d)CMP kinase [Treponema sp.]|jgi:cytidylate kinase|nr:(d)CMP kinase [Treponema sp.]